MFFDYKKDKNEEENMNKILLGLPVAAVAVFALTSRVSAAGNVMYSSMPSGRKSIPITRRVTNIGGKINASFSFALAEKEGNPAPVRGLQTSTSVNVIDGGPDQTGVWKSNNSLYLGNMSFSKVGDYVFVLTEVSTSDEENFPRDTNEYEIYFRVTNKLDANNNPTGELNIELMDYLWSKKADGKVGLNDAIFESVGNYTHISLENKVTGDLADTDKYFKYEIGFDGVITGSTLTISGQDEEVDYDGETVTTTHEYTVGDDTLIVYLKHGQTATIGERLTRGMTVNELPQGASYTIIKLDDDGYTTSIDGQAVSTVTKSVAKNDSDDFATHNTTVVGNNKESTVNTGAFVSVWPFAAIAVVSLGGAFVMRKVTKNI